MVNVNYTFLWCEEVKVYITTATIVSIGFVARTICYICMTVSVCYMVGSIASKTFISTRCVGVTIINVCPTLTNALMVSRVAEAGESIL